MFKYFLEPADGNYSQKVQKHLDDFNAYFAGKSFFEVFLFHTT